MSGHGVHPVGNSRNHSAIQATTVQSAGNTAQTNAGAAGGARPRRPPDSSGKAGGSSGSGLPQDGKCLISSKTCPQTLIFIIALIRYH